MKQAILVTAYKNPEHIASLIDYFTEDFVFYIHIDKKSKIDFSPLKNCLGKNVFIFKKFVVNWGGLNHLKTILFLSEEALKNKEISFVHLITGQDFPTKPVSYFTYVLDKTKNYLEYFELPSKNWSGDGGLERLTYYHFYDVLDAKKKRRALKALKLLQQLFKIKRLLPSYIPKLYGGSTYWSLTRTTLQYVLDYTRRDHRFLDRMKYTFCSEEIYIPTIIMNSVHSAEVVNDNLRYIDWNTGRGGVPAVIDESDFPAIQSSNKLFARKFNSPESDKLKQMLSDSFRS